jgi:hypothetical protein
MSRGQRDSTKKDYAMYWRKVKKILFGWLRCTIQMTFILERLIGFPSIKK